MGGFLMRTCRARVCARVAQALFLLLLVSCAASHTDHTPLPTLKELNERPTTLESIPDLQPVSWKLPNGLEVMFLSTDELPLVSGALYLRSGTLWEESAYPGSISVMGDQLRAGGAGDLTADKLDEKLEALSAGISSSFSQEYGRVGFNCLETDIDEVFSLFADVVLRPRFEEDRIGLWKGQALESIKRRVDDPSTVAAVSFTQLLYPHSPFGKILTSRDVQKISRELLKATHERMIFPDNAIIAISGKISADKVKSLIEQHFGSWKARGVALPVPPKVLEPKAPGIYFISQPLAQSTVVMGELGVSRLTHDYLPIDVFNSVFGTGGFGSRLMQRVRTELGLAYGVFGSVNSGLVRGKNQIFLQTKAETTGLAIQEAANVLRGLTQELVPEEELEESKSNIQNSFVFGFDQPSKVLGREVVLKLMGFPADFDQTYLPGIKAVQSADIRQVARERWNPQNWIIVVVGNETAYGDLGRMVKDKSSPFFGFRIKRARFEERLEF